MSVVNCVGVKIVPAPVVQLLVAILLAVAVMVIVSPKHTVSTGVIVIKGI